MNKNTSFEILDMHEPFVGRQKELKWLDHHLEKVLNYSGRFVLIQGEIGVGKTRLLNQFVDEVRTTGLHILNGRTIRDEAKPFSPFIQMIEDYICSMENRPSWVAKFLDPEIAPYFIHLMPKLKDYYPLDMPHLEQPIDNLSFLYSFQRFFENLSKSKPLVLILDDIQWMSRESIELLKYLVRRIVNQSILIVASTRLYKDNLVLQQTIDEFNTARLVFDINLANFSQNETENLVNQKFKNDIPSHFVHWLFTITKGNPLFIEEIIKTLIRQNIIRHDVDKNEWLVEEDYENFPISATVESVISYRLGNLTAPELKLLQGAAVIGERFSLKTLGKLIGSMPKKQFLRSYNILIASGLIKDFKDTKQFSHPLIHELLYQKMEINKRRKLHRRLASILKDIKASDEEIAFHMTKDLTPSEETEALILYLFKISQGFLNTYSYRLAWQYLKIAKGMAERILPLDIQRMKIKAEFDHLALILGRDIASFQDAKRFVMELERNDLRKEASIHYQMLFYRALITQDLAAAGEYLDKAISLVQNDDAFYWTLRVEHCLLQRRRGLLKESVEEARKLGTEIPPSRAPQAFYKVHHNLGMVSYLTGDLESAHHYVSRALETAVEYHLLSDIGAAYTNLGLVEMTMGKLDSAMIRLKDSMAKTGLLQDENLSAINLNFIGACFLYMGEYARAIIYFDRASEKASTLNNPRIRLVAQLGKAQVFIESGDIEKAESILKDIPEDEIEKASYCDLQLKKGSIHLMKGELDLAEEFLDKALKYAERMHFETRFANALGKKAQVLLQRRQRGQALKFFEEARNRLLSMGAMPILSDMLVGFGLIMGDAQGEAIFIQGLRVLFDMHAHARISGLCKAMESVGFDNALEYIRERMQDVSVNKIDVCTFGGLSVSMPGELNVVAKKEWQSRKAQELMGLILVLSHAGSVTREKLTSYLWPETTKKKSQANFRVTLTHLNKVLGNDVILQKSTFITLNQDIIQVDLWAFDRFVKEWQDLKQCGKLHPAEDRARKAIALYKGDVLPEFYCQPIVEKQRESKNRLQDLLYWLAARCMERVEWQEAVNFARRLLTMDLNDERACRIIMNGLYNQGDRIGAIRQFERLKNGLQDELDVEPSPETTKLYKRITGAG